MISKTLAYVISRTAAGRGAAVALAAVVVVWSVGASAKTAPDGFADLAAKLLPSVVNISTTQTVEGREGPAMPQLPPGSPFEDFFKEFFDRNQPQQRKHKATSLGSGFIISADGYVVTNNHVIADADEISVILQDDTRIKAELVGRDTKTDLAVLKIKSDRKLTAVKFGNSKKARVGDWVVAIGNPFGLGGTVTAGIISARGRDINAGPYDDFIQTDASINRGNSGGPMFNLAGEVIGINTAIFSPSGGSVGIGFAIPASTAEPVISQLIKSGAVKRGWLGVHIQAVTEEIAETLGLKKAEGALVANVIEDSPAAKGGIKSGDVILEFDGKSVHEMRSLPRIVAETEVGKPVDVSIWREGKPATVKVAVGELKDDGKQASAEQGSSPNTGPGGELTIDELGLTLSPLTDKVRERFKLKADAKGVVVTKVESDGPAGAKDIRPGDVIIEVSQEEISTPAEVRTKIAAAKKAGRKSVLLHLEGQNGLRFVAVRIEKG
jgi:serine protease Do